MFEKIYKTPTLLNINEDISISPLKSYQFAQSSSIVALSIDEVPVASMSYPIVFYKGVDGIMPVAILSARVDENLFINKNGKYKDEFYIPSFFKMYPFIALKSEDEKHTIVYDGSYKGVNAKDSTIDIIKDKKLTENGKSIINNINTQYFGFERAKDTLSFIDSLGLLEKVDFDIPNKTAQKRYLLKGFLQINAKKVNELSDDDLLKLIKNGGLNMINFHLASLVNIKKISNRLID
jgi:hypothetical protein